MTLQAIKDALLTVTSKVYHFAPTQTVTGNYIVWAEDGQAASVCADGEMVEQAIQGTIDYYTKTEYDPNVAKIQKAITGICPWRLNSIQREETTGYIHYEWVFESGNGYI